MRLRPAAEGAELLVAAIPTRYLRETLGAISNQIPDGVPVVSVAKGVEIATLMRPSEIITDVLGPRGVVALGGPSHAEEIARRMPASVVAASRGSRAGPPRAGRCSIPTAFAFTPMPTLSASNWPAPSKT